MLVGVLPTCPLVVLGCLHARLRTAYFGESNSRTLTVLVLMGLAEPHGAQEVLSGYKWDTQKGESPRGGVSLGHVLIRTNEDYYN